MSAENLSEIGVTSIDATLEGLPVTASQAKERRDYRFLMGLIAGATFGVGLGMLLAPRAVVEFRERVANSAKDAGRAASERYQHASARVGAAAQEVTSKGRAIRDTVIRGAQKIEEFAKAAKAEQEQKVPEHSAP